MRVPSTPSGSGGARPRRDGPPRIAVPPCSARAFPQGKRQATRSVAARAFPQGKRQATRSVAGYAATGAVLLLANSPVMIGTVILMSRVKTRKPMEKMAAPMRISWSVGTYS